jgi:hypothetical protein
MTEVGAPLTLDPAAHPCLCCADHNPDPTLNHRHHIVPLSWGGSDTDDNTTPVCPTAHETIHQVLRAWERQGEPDDRRLRPFIRSLCQRAWEGRR